MEILRNTMSLTRNLFTSTRVLEIFIKTIQNCFSTTRCTYASPAVNPRLVRMMDRAGHHLNTISTFLVDVGRKFLEELPATIDFIQHQLTKEVKSPIRRIFHEYL